VGLSDSLFNEKKSQQIAELNTKYETEKKDKDIALLNKDKEIREAEIKKQKLQKYSFIGGLGLVIVLLLFGYRAYRTQQSLRLQSIRNKISGDLHDDIGSTLNSISVYSEVARKKDEQQDEALEMIGEASRKIIEAMSDIVWTINPENDSFEKIIFRMKSLAYNLFKAKKIEFTFHADEILNEKKLSLEERRNFYLIFKEAINNLVKYSNAARVAITLTNENDTIKLSIKDDGVGFEMADDTTGNGLKNMKRRAMEMKAQFNIESGKGNGTQIELTLKA
jgi:signal transduction histidine kinase